MLVNRDSINLVFRSLRAEFRNAYTREEPKWPLYAMQTSSSTKVEEHPWLTDFPQMREWVDERRLKQLLAHNYTLVNRDFESTIRIDRNDFDDDRLGLLSTQARGAGDAARSWKDELVATAVNNSFNASYTDTRGTKVDVRCHDGKPFFAADHPLDEAPAFSNKLDKALKADSLADASASFGAAETMLMEMTDWEGRPMGLTPKVLLVPPALKATASLLMLGDKLGGDDPNPYKGAATVVCSARLSSKTRWFLTAEGGGGLLPFLLQLRKEPTPEQMMDPDNPHVFLKREYLFGVHGRGASGYTLPQLAVGSTGAK